MRLVACALVFAVFASGCADVTGPPTIVWKAVPSTAQAGHQFYANYSIDRPGGFRSVTQVDVWGTRGSAEPADLATYSIALDPTPSLEEPSPCPEKVDTRYLGCDVNDLVVLQGPGTYWVRARAVVDGVEAWSAPASVLVA